MNLHQFLQSISRPYGARLYVLFHLKYVFACFQLIIKISTSRRVLISAQMYAINLLFLNKSRTCWVLG